MFSDDVVGRSCFLFLLFVAIIGYGYLLVFLFWLLPVSLLGSNVVKLLYKDAMIVVLAFLLFDLFVLEKRRVKNVAEHREEWLARLRSWGR
ncbi:MAG: hypothetical protein WC582_02385 [Patescibacteria group bacterium]